MLLAGLVVAGESLLHRLAGDLDRDRPALAHVHRRRLEHGQRPPRIAVGLDGHERQRVGLHRQPRPAQAALGVGQGALEQQLDVLRD